MIPAWNQYTTKNSKYGVLVGNLMNDSTFLVQLAFF